MTAEEPLRRFIRKTWRILNQSKDLEEAKEKFKLLVLDFMTTD